MAKILKEKIRITYLAVAVKNPGYVWGKKLWSFNAWVHHGNTFSEYGGSTKFPVKKKHAFNLPKKSFSIDIDVTGRRSIKIAFEAKLQNARLGRCALGRNRPAPHVLWRLAPWVLEFATFVGNM